MKIYHNPRCSKSRQTLEIIRSKGIEPEIVLYLKDSPSKNEIKKMLKKLNLNIDDIIRKGEKLYKENYRDKEYTKEQWIDILVENPSLMERPIVTVDNRAVIGRPPGRVLTLL